MRKIALLLSIALIAWITGASYYYVCVIKKHCNCSEELEKSAPAAISDSNTPDSLLIKDSTLVEKPDTLANQLVEIREFLNSKSSEGIVFDFAKKTTNLSAENNEYLDKVLFLLQNDTSSKIRIDGHSDNIGSEEAKEKFGKDRAEFLKNALINKGANPNQIETKSHSDKKPIATNNTEEGRAKNRRTEILILNQ